MFAFSFVFGGDSYLAWTSYGLRWNFSSQCISKQSKEKPSHDDVPVLFCFTRSNPVRCDPIQNKVSKLPYLKHLPNHSCDYCQRKIGHFVFFCWNNKCHWYFKQKCIEMQTIRKVFVVSNHQPNCNRNCKCPSAISHE